MFEIFTKKERIVLKEIFMNANSACGAETIEDLINDNYSWIDIKTLAKLTNLNEKQLGGVISSLWKKDQIIDEEIREDDTDLFFLNLSWLEKLNSKFNFVEYFKND